MSISSTPSSRATIRTATIRDLPPILALLDASSLPTAGVVDALEGFLVAESGDDIVGVIDIEACCARYALLRSTAVAETWRGRGLGRKLVERAVAEAEAKGFAALYLLTTTAEAYFPSFGFRATTRDTVPDEVRASVEFQGAYPASATVMCLNLFAPSFASR